MIRLKCDVQNLSVDIIDECESTPGISRQITAFKQYVLNGLRRKISMIKKDKDFLSKLNAALAIMNNNDFQLVNSSVKDGIIINEYEYIGDE